MATQIIFFVYFEARVSLNSSIKQKIRNVIWSLCCICNIFILIEAFQSTLHMSIIFLYFFFTIAKLIQLCRVKFKIAFQLLTVATGKIFFSEIVHIVSSKVKNKMSEWKNNVSMQISSSDSWMKIAKLKFLTKLLSLEMKLSLSK